VSRFSFIRSLIDNMGTSDGYRSPEKLTVRSIADRVARETGIAVADIVGPNRTLPAAHARQEVMRRAHRTGQFSMAQIGRELGRDHTTVIHGINAATQRICQ